MSSGRLSIIPAPAVCDPRISPQAIRVLCVLGKHADTDTGWCSRSQVKIARELSIARSTVQKAIADLVSAGWVEHRVRVRESGGDRAHEYRIRYDFTDDDVVAATAKPNENPSKRENRSSGDDCNPNMVSNDEVHPNDPQYMGGADLSAGGADISAGGADPDRQGVPTQTGRGCRPRPAPSRTTPLKRPHFNEGPLTPKTGISENSGFELVSPSPPQDDLALAVEIWNAMASANGLPQCQKLTKARRSGLKARLADCGGLEGWREACNRVPGSPFLLGENKRGWKADIEFILREARFTKLMEGGYDRSERQQSENRSNSAGIVDWYAQRLGAGPYREGDDHAERQEVGALPPRR